MRGAMLCLDLGSSCGWAVRMPGEGEARSLITSGTWDCHRAGHEDEAEQFMKFRSYLTETKVRLDKLGVPLVQVRYERVDFIAKKNGVYSVHLWGAWWGLLLHWCRHHGIQSKGYAVSAIKARIAGSGKASKDAIGRAIKARGFRPRTDDEADAIALALILERT